MRAWIGALAFLAVAQMAGAAPATFALTVVDGKLGGSGAEVLRAELPEAQFILYGEDHGFADSALVLRAIANEARPFGFKYHVVEVGPLSTRLIGSTLSKEGTKGLHNLVHDVPLGIPFLSLKDDAELASDFLGRDAKGTPYLWGVDQEFIGSPPFHLKRLVEIAPNDAARDAAMKLLREEKKAAADASQKDFLLVRYHDADFDALAALFDGQTEAEQIITELKESAGIYQLWMNGHNYENNARRARFLARHFLDFYRAAAEPEPKVVFKMGVEHVGLGTTTINTVDLGTLVSKMAQLHGKTALRIAFLPAGGEHVAFQPKKGSPVTIEAYKAEEAKDLLAGIGLNPATLPKDSWTLIAMEPLRQTIDTQGIEKLNPVARFVLLGFDYVITTPNAKAAVSLY